MKITLSSDEFRGVIMTELKKQYASLGDVTDFSFSNIYFDYEDDDHPIEMSSDTVMYVYFEDDSCKQSQDSK